MGYIDKKVFQGALQIVDVLTNKGFEVFFAGGFARDTLLQKPSYDIDIATNASVEEISKLFEKCYFVGANFGVVQVVINKISYEVATFRKDLESSDGRRPKGIEPSSAKEDAFRRDFTINGMFYDPQNKTIVDYVGGKQDIENKVIRAIGKPEERFEEDRLRMIRACRFAVRFHFQIEAETKRAIQNWADKLFPSVSFERIVDELKKMCQFPGFSIALQLLDECKLLEQIFPGKPFSEQSFQRIQDLSSHIPLVLHLSAFLESNKNEKCALFKQMKLSNAELALFELFESFKECNFDVVALTELLAKRHSEICVQTLETLYPEKMQTVKEHQQVYARDIERIRNHTPIVSAEDLIELGVKRGPMLGRLLQAAKEISIRERVEDKAELIDKVKRLDFWPI